jgi:hypothetical protein
VHIVFRFEYVNERDHSEDIGIDGRIILEWILGNRLVLRNVPVCHHYYFT